MRTIPTRPALMTPAVEHALEQLHHDEWLLADYAALGHDPAEVGAQP